MERRKAMATALAGAMTLGLGTICLAAVGGAPMLGLASADEAAMLESVTEVQMIDRVVVVHSSTTTIPGEVPLVVLTAPGGAPVAPAAVAPAASPVVIGPAAPAPTTPPTTKAATSPAPGTQPPAATAGPTLAAPTATPAPAVAPVTTSKPTTTPAPATAAPTTAKPATTVATTTTVKAVTPTTVRPPGVPRDWPAGKPIPPMPPNCKQPQLELNGVWNCDD
jgi:hypothetical protein